MRKLVLVGGLALLVLFGAATARAQDGWGVSVGVPVNYKFSKDEVTGQAPDAIPPSGIRVMALTPVRLGIGFGKYTGGFADDIFPWSKRKIEYSFLEVQFNLPVDPVVFAVGFGLGGADFSPASVTAGPFTWEFMHSNAQEWFLVAGYRLTEQLDVQASLHAMTIDAKFELNGTPGSGDIGATMTTVGVGWHF